MTRPVVLSTNVQRVPLGEPCPVCAERGHSRHYHGELAQIDGEVITEDELRLRRVLPPKISALIDRLAP